MKSIETTPAERLAALRGNEYFDDLPETLSQEIAARMQLREYQRADTLFWEGDPCDGLYIIRQGSAKIFRISPQGRQYIVRILQEGDTFAEVPAFDGSTSPVNVEALENCSVWVIDAKLLRELLISHPGFAQKVLANFGRMLRGMVYKISEMAFYQVTHRLARLICEEITDKKSAPPWTQEQLAARLGTVREVVARSLKELERSGAIKVEDRQIRVLDGEIFRQWLQPGN
jgi:CRP/FNR family transcriptional regulator, cyclic AMP receptor protein